MVELVDWKGDRIRELYDRMWQIVAEKQGVSVDEAQRTHDIRALWDQDFDGHREAVYVLLWGSYDGDRQTDAESFNMQPIGKFEVVGIYGWCNGNAGRTINAIKVWVDDRKVLEVPGIFLSSEWTNDIFVFDDPFCATKTHNLRIIPNVSSAAPYTRAFPLGWGILARR